jgi:hypothetical protein
MLNRTDPSLAGSAYLFAPYLALFGVVVGVAIVVVKPWKKLDRD